MELITRLKRQFPSLVVGFGDRKGDADAYVANGMRAYIMPSKKQVYPESAVVVSGWSEIQEHLKRYPVTY
jgi:hypothetical protein